MIRTTVSQLLDLFTHSSSSASKDKCPIGFASVYSPVAPKRKRGRLCARKEAADLPR